MDNMNIFDYMREQKKDKESPLASRMRPTTLDEVVGQEHIIGKDKMLYRAIKADKLSSVIFYGPPGTGKTTLAKVIANTTKADFEQINATVAGKKDMVEVVEKAKETYGMYGRRTILFIDEIHRFNKGQQDYLLPYVEDGTIILIGATTENPYFEVNSALISRSVVFELKTLSKENIKTIIMRALTDKEKGMGSYHAVIDDDALDFLADTANGDARRALNAIELAVLTTEPTVEPDEQTSSEQKADKASSDHTTDKIVSDRTTDKAKSDKTDSKTHQVIRITLKTASECIQKRVVRYDKDGDNHYDTISAFIKSMRGSDPDAAVYYLARMLYAGEDVKFIARRIMICASEDVGNADPMAMVVAASAASEVERVGMPESQLILSQATIYVACAPKSNACTEAIYSAMSAVKNTITDPVPVHLQDAHYGGSSKLGHGVGYKYAHDYPNHYVKQQYLPDSLVGTRFYEPTDIGKEKEISEYLRFIKEESDR